VRAGTSTTGIAAVPRIAAGLELLTDPPSPALSCGDAPSGSVTASQLRKACLAFAGASEEYPFGPQAAVFKVAGKIFAISMLEARPLQVSLKCEPSLAEQLRAAHPAIAPGYHLNKRHWNTVTLDGSLPNRMVHEMLEDSYDLIVSALPRARREELGWTASRRA
jgi:predicted DNA-binding protein (MmcQ/YjbR family)